MSTLADAYTFDSGLRHLMSDGLEVFEITLRSRLGYFMAEAGAAYTYRDAATYRTAIVGTPLSDSRTQYMCSPCQGMESYEYPSCACCVEKVKDRS